MEKVKRMGVGLSTSGPRSFREASAHPPVQHMGPRETALHWWIRSQQLGASRPKMRTSRTCKPRSSTPVSKNPERKEWGPTLWRSGCPKCGRPCPSSRRWPASRTQGRPCRSTSQDMAQPLHGLQCSLSAPSLIPMTINNFVTQSCSPLRNGLPNLPRPRQPDYARCGASPARLQPSDMILRQTKTVQAECACCGPESLRCRA